MSINKLQNNITTLDIISKTNDVVEKTNITSGGWVRKGLIPYSYPSTLKHTEEPTIYTIDLSSYLPNDNENYEILLYYGGTGNLVVGTDFHNVLGGVYSNSAYRQCHTVVVGAQRKILLRVCEKDVTNFEFQIAAYKQVTSDINHKLEDDLSNLSNSGTSAIETLIANKAKDYGFPSDNYVDFEIGVSDTSYLAPANGWFSAEYRYDTSGKYLNMYIIESDLRVDAISTNSWLSQFIPISKGQHVIIGYNTPTLTRVRFFYAND